MRLFLALLVFVSVGCASPYFRAKHEGVSVETGYDTGKKGSATAACDDQLRVIAARLRAYCGAVREEPRPVCVEIAAFEAWILGVRCYFRD